MAFKVLYKVYCGSNGKWYTFYQEYKARNLYNTMINQNKHTKILKIENGKEELLEEYL